MPLRIRTTWSKIGIETQKSRPNIRQPRGELQIRRSAAKMSIDREMPRVLIDQSACFADIGLKSCAGLIKENSAYAVQAVREGIDRRIREGRLLAAIEKGFAAIPYIAWVNTHRETSINIDFIPKNRPSFEVTGHLRIDWQPGYIKTRYTPHRPVIKWQPGDLKVYLRQKGKIEFNYIDEKA